MSEDRAVYKPTVMSDPAQSAVRTITLVWTDAPAPDAWGAPKLDIHLDNVDNFEQMDRIFRQAALFAESHLQKPCFHLFTEEYEKEKKLDAYRRD